MSKYVEVSAIKRDLEELKSQLEENQSEQMELRSV